MKYNIKVQELPPIMRTGKRLEEIYHSLFCKLISIKGIKCNKSNNEDKTKKRLEYYQLNLQTSA